MKFSFYNEQFEADGKKYLYNIFSTALIEIDDDVYNTIKNGDVGRLNPDYIEPMAAMHFIVNDDMRNICIFTIQYATAARQKFFKWYLFRRTTAICAAPIVCKVSARNVK